MALERITVRRARKQHRCGEGHPIKPGDVYLEHVVGPGHAGLGNTRWRRLPECADCARRYGRGELLEVPGAA